METTLVMPEQAALGDLTSRPPPCTERRHRWSDEQRCRDTGNGANIFTDACVHCGVVRLRRRSYLGCASDGPHGDGRDWTRYRAVLPDASNNDGGCAF